MKKLILVIIFSLSTALLASEVQPQLMNFRAYYASVLNALSMKTFLTEKELLDSTLPDSEDPNGFNVSSSVGYAKLASQACNRCYEDEGCYTKLFENKDCEKSLSQTAIIQHLGQKFLGRKLSQDELDALRVYKTDQVSVTDGVFAEEGENVVQKYCINKEVFVSTCTTILSTPIFIFLK